MIGYVRKILPQSSVDGPGNRVAIFMQGCDFNCSYCHNPETIPVINAGDRFKMTVEELVETVKKYQDYISGVTFSGGECTLQYPFLKAATEALHKIGISVFIDSNGNTEHDKLIDLVPFVDGFMIDLKALDSKKHIELTLVDNTRVLSNLITLSKLAKLYEVRMVIATSINEPKAMIEWVALNVLKNDPNIKLKLIKYRPLGVRKRAASLQTPDDAFMEVLKDFAEQNGFKDVIIK